jgi:hypothetical protein
MDVIEVCVEDSGTDAEVLLRGFGSTIATKAWRDELGVWHCPGVVLVNPKHCRRPLDGNVLVDRRRDGSVGWVILGFESATYYPPGSPEPVPVGWNPKKVTYPGKRRITNDPIQ